MKKLVIYCHYYKPNIRCKYYYIIGDINSNQFREEINLSLRNQFKFEYNKKLFEDIQNKNLKYDDLKKFNNSNEVEKIMIGSITDNNKFSIDSGIYEI